MKVIATFAHNIRVVNKEINVLRDSACIELGIGAERIFPSPKQCHTTSTRNSQVIVLVEFIVLD